MADSAISKMADFLMAIWHNCVHSDRSFEQDRESYSLFKV